MLVLKILDDAEKNKRFFFVKRKAFCNQVLRRYSINVNGKTVIVVELTKKDLHRDDVLTLLKVYKGRVLVSEEYHNEDFIKDYLYNPEEYYQRAVLSSLVNQLKTVGKDWNNVVIKTENFLLFKEFYDIVRISKKVTIVTEPDTRTEKFLRECYYEYGAIIYIKNELKNENCDVFLDLNNIDNKGKSMINVRGKEFVLYPDIRYFDDCNEYKKLLEYNIEHNIICGAFSDK